MLARAKKFYKVILLTRRFCAQKLELRGGFLIAQASLSAILVRMQSTPSPETNVDLARCRAEFIGQVGHEAPRISWSKADNDEKLRRSAEARKAWRDAHPCRG